MKRNFFWQTAVIWGSVMTVVNAIGIFFARGVFGLAGFFVMAIICLAWVLQALLDNKPLRLASLLVSTMLVIFGAGVQGFRLAGFFRNMSFVGLLCAGLDLLVGLLVAVLAANKKSV